MADRSWRVCWQNLKRSIKPWFCRSADTCRHDKKPSSKCSEYSKRNTQTQNSNVLLQICSKNELQHAPSTQNAIFNLKSIFVLICFLLIFREVVGIFRYHTKTWKHATRAGHAQAEPLSSRQQLLRMRLLTRSISWTKVCKKNFGQSYHECSWSYCTKISKPMPYNQFRNTTKSCHYAYMVLECYKKTGLRNRHKTQDTQQKT